MQKKKRKHSSTQFTWHDFQKTIICYQNDRRSRGIHGIAAIVSALEMKFHASPEIGEDEFPVLVEVHKRNKSLLLRLAQHLIDMMQDMEHMFQFLSFVGEKDDKLFQYPCEKDFMMHDGRRFMVVHNILGLQVENLFKTYCLRSVITEEKV